MAKTWATLKGNLVLNDHLDNVRARVARVRRRAPIVPQGAYSGGGQFLFRSVPPVDGGLSDSGLGRDSLDRHASVALVRQ